MKISQLNDDIWKNLNTPKDSDQGYSGEYLSLNNDNPSDLMIFRDESLNYHFVIPSAKDFKNGIKDPKVNGLSIMLKKYRILGESSVRQYIDIECKHDSYIDEFSRIVQEIAERILTESTSPVVIIYEVINSWKSFWGPTSGQILTEEQQIGLICELFFLNELCKINPANGIASWKGPLKEKHDFVFTDWVFEIKGTKREGHIHIINGLEQMKSPSEKQLGLVSFILANSDSDNAKSLFDLVSEIELKRLKNKPDLVQKYFDLLKCAGYNPIFKEDYQRAKVDFIDIRLFVVDENFPKLTADNLIKPLDSRISKIRYEINLEMVNSKELKNIHLTNYFY
jgi:hypothetical protein